MDLEESRTPFIILGIAVPTVVLGIFLFTPIGVGVGGGTKYCMVNVTVTGTFQSNIANYITGLVINPSEGSCSLLPTMLNVAMNIFPYSFQGTITAGDASKTVGVNVPALQTSYPFTVSTSFSLVLGTYTITWTSPLAIGGPLSSTFSQSASFTVS